MHMRRPLIAVIAGAIVVVVIVVAVVVFGVGRSQAPPQPSSPYTAAVLVPGEEKVLNSYGWVDQKAGIARIPISRAIDIIAAQGLPSRPAMSAQTKAAAETIPSYSSSGTQPREWLH